MTLNEIINVFEELVANHLQLNYFGFGEISNIKTTEKQYPFLWLSPSNQSTINITQSGFNTNLSFNMLVLDRVNFTGDEINYPDVMSDTLQIIQDVLHEFIRDYNRKNGINLNASATLNPVNEGDDSTKSREIGWYITITMKLPYTGCYTPKI